MLKVKVLGSNLSCTTPKVVVYPRYDISYKAHIFSKFSLLKILEARKTLTLFFLLVLIVFLLCFPCRIIELLSFHEHTDDGFLLGFRC